MDEGSISRRLKQIRHNIKDYNGERRNANATSFRGIERSETPDPNFDSRTLEKYKQELSEERQDLEEYYSKFYEHPGSHLAYKEEWELFWQRRSIELIRVRIDPLNYNFDSEWKDVFYKFLKGEQANKYAEIKKLLFNKYSRINKSQWRNRRDSKNESRSSRSSHRSNFRSRSNSRHHYRKSRSHERNRRQSRRRSHSHSRDIKKRVKVEKFEEVKEIQTRLNPHSVTKVCFEILKLDYKVKFKREKVRDLMEKAINFEKCHLREYTMTEDENEKFLNLKEDLDYMINGKSKFPENIVSQINKIRYNLSVLIKRWKCHMNKRNARTSKIKCNDNRTFFKGKKFSFKFAGKSKHREETFINRQQGINYVSPWNNNKKDDDWSDSLQSSSSNSIEKQQSHSKNAPSTSLAFPVNPAIKQEINFLNTLKEIKKERTDTELEILNQEKKKLEEMIFNERKMSSSPIDNSHDSQEQGLVIDETHKADGELDNPMEEGTITAADITNEELIELFKDFETSSEEELYFVQQVMEELKHTDPPRFMHLTIAMEEIQRSIELEFMNFISNELEEGTINICVKQEEITVENEICFDNNQL